MERFERFNINPVDPPRCESTSDIVCCEVVTVTGTIGRGDIETGRGEVVIGRGDINGAEFCVAVVVTTNAIAKSPSDVCCELEPRTGSSEMDINAAEFCVAAANAACSFTVNGSKPLSLLSNNRINDSSTNVSSSPSCKHSC